MSLEGLVITDRRLGESGFGSVFMCKLGEIKVAVKRLSQSEREFKNLVNEAIKLKILRHGKHIAYTYGISWEGDNLYMVMEYSECGDLQNYLKKNRGSVTYEQKILFCRGILLGLLYCHSMNVFHGNIKCSNVILGKNLEPRLTDFGLSMTVDNIKGYCKTREGSIQWTAPELFSMRKEGGFKEFKADPYPTDVYSLGATFCEVSFDGTTEFINSDDIEMDISLGLASPMPKNAFLKEIIDECCQFERDERIPLDECLIALDNVAEEQLLVPAIDNKWQRIQQDIAVDLKFELPPSFVLHRPTKNLVVGPSNLSLLEWLCIKDCIEAAKYMTQLHNPDKKQLKWLYNISTLCSSPNATDFFQSMLQDNADIPLKLSDIIDINPWQFIEVLIKAGANCKEEYLLDKAVKGHYNKMMELLIDNNAHFVTAVIHDAIGSRNTEAVRILAGRANLEFRDINGDTPLLAAINTGNIEIVKILLGRKVNIHNKNSRSRHISRTEGQHTPLIRAAVKGNLEILELLINAGATIDTESSEWHSLLQDLEEQGGSTIIQLISDAMRRGAKAIEENHGITIIISNSGDKNEKSAEATSLCIAIRNKQSDLMQKLINDGADANEHDYDGYSPLHWAVIIGDKMVVRVLLKAGADIDAKTPNEEHNFYAVSSSNYFNEYTSLHIAIVKRYLGIAKLLIESGANFSLRSKAGKTIMDIADKDDRRRIECVIRECVPVTVDSFQWILETMDIETAKTLISGRNVSMDTLNHFLCIAAYHGSIEPVNYLLEHKTKINSKYGGKSPLEWAISGGHAQIVQILIDQGADIHSERIKKHNSKSVIKALKNLFSGKKDETNEMQNLSGSLLHQAAALNNVEIVEILLNAGVDIEIKNDNGYNALYYAALCECDEVVALLYEKGAKVKLWEKAEDSDAIYETAKHIVHKAAETGKASTEKIFTDAGVGVDFENKNNSVPSLPKMLDKNEMTAESSQSSSVLSNANLDKINALAEAARNNQLERVHLFLEAGFDINAKDTNGVAPLFYCIDRSLVDMVRLLIEKGADVNARDKDGFAPIHYVNDKEIMGILINAGADINAKSANSRTLLFECIDESLVDMVRFLIEKGADVNARTKDGFAPIHHAKDKKVAEILISHGADVNAKSTNGRTLLFECVNKSLIDMVQFLIEKGVDVNARDKDGFTPVHCVNDREVAEILIANGADINAKSISGLTPLFVCVGESLIDIVHFLVEKGADINARDKDGFAPIYCVKNREIAEILVSHGADVNVKNINGLTPLFEYVDESLVDMVQFLVEKGADVNDREKGGFTPIHYAKSRKIAEILVSHGADVNVRSTNGRTLLFDYVNESLVDMVQFLIEKGVDVNARDNDGFTPIHYVKSREIAEILISHGADVNAKSTNCGTPLFLCVEQSLMDIVQFLIEKGADVNARDKDGFIPIYYVKDREIAEILIAHGADINAKNANGRTPLFECVNESLVDMVQFLLEKGVDVNARDNDFFAPIHYVKNEEIAEILIAHGADINAKNASGLTPLFVCIGELLADMVCFLIEKGADINARDKDGFAPIHYAKSREIAGILVFYGVDVNAKSINGLTPLFEYVNESLVDVVHFLVEKGADINARTKDGFAPIHCVKNEEIAEILVSHGADINAKSANGRTLLFGCVEESLIDIVLLLVEKGADVNTRDKDGFTPIHYVKSREIAEILISHGASINTKSTNGETPLFGCVEESLLDIIQLLVEKGADVNAKTEDGFAPIHYVKNREIAEILVSHGADVNTKNNNGKTLFNILLEKQNRNLDSSIYKGKEVCELLEYLKNLK